MGNHAALLDQLFDELHNDAGDAFCVVHHGLRLPASDPRATELVKRGGSLTWVTLSWPPIDMWDLHVGVLVGNDVRVGLHVADSAHEDLHRVAARLGGSWGELTVSIEAQEKQWNRTIDAESACHSARRLASLVGQTLTNEGLLENSTTNT